MKPIGLQLYSVRDMAEKDFFGTLRKVAEIGYAGVELSVFHGHKPDDVKKAMDDLGLKVISSHDGLPADQAAFDNIVAQAKLFGHDLTVVGWASPENFQTLDAVRKLADRLEAHAQRLKPHGLKLAYHNHAQEMVPLGDDYALGHLYNFAPAIWGQTDIFWASNFGKADPVSFVRRHARRINTLHVKDGPLVEGKNWLAVGSGKVKVADCIHAADENVLKWLIVELDACDTDMLTAVRESYQFLVRNKLGTGKK
jgi:sugar phosphate isomerase/epimerase